MTVCVCVCFFFDDDDDEDNSQSPRVTAPPYDTHTLACTQMPHPLSLSNGLASPPRAKTSTLTPVQRLPLSSKPDLEQTVCDEHK